MVTKRVLVPSRVRRVPTQGFSWVDRLFVRDHAPGLGRDAILLYLFLAAVSDKDGLSFWSDASIAARLKLELGSVAPAREELERRGLVVYEAPLTQVLSLPEPRRRRAPGGSDVESFGEILRRLGGQP